MSKQSDPCSVLVTGGCGFIGTNLVHTLVDKGYEVSVLDDLSVGSLYFLEGLDFKFTKGSILNEDSVNAATAGVDAVVHLAAHTSVIDSIEKPELDCELNVFGTLRLLQACVRNSVRKFVLASSNAPVGEQDPPTNELKVPSPLSPYGASKLACEGYCAAFHGSYGLETVSLRFANAYGVFSSHKTSVVARFLGLVIEDRPVTIYGDGSQTRDFVNARDLCQGMIAALDSNLAGELVCLGSGTETSVVDLVRLLREVSGREIRTEFKPARAGEILRNYTDIAKARRLLGYSPQVDLADGLRECYEWFVNQGAQG